MNKTDITRIARKLWNTYQERDPVKLCETLGIRIMRLPLGTDRNCIKGMIVKNNRCYGIVVNSGLSEHEIKLVLFHELGHFALDHVETAGLARTCTNLNPVDDGTIEARKEIEANEFLVEYLMDTEETMENLRSTGSFFETASIMRVTPDLMAFKWRMLKYYNLVSGQCPIDARSDCMGKIGYRGDEYNGVEYSGDEYCDGDYWRHDANQWNEYNSYDDDGYT